MVEYLLDIDRFLYFMQVEFVAKGFGPTFDVAEGWGVGAVFPVDYHTTLDTDLVSKVAFVKAKFFADGAEFADEWGGEHSELDPSVGFKFRQELGENRG
jgi:hypothetical protein